VSRREPDPPATVAFAGAGAISVVHGLAAIATETAVVAIASRTEATATERASQLQARVVSFDELPTAADAVIVCTPPDRHAADALHAIAGGAAVLIEKPLASTLAEADSIVEAGGRVVYGENQFFSPVVRRMLELAGTIGRLEFVEVRALSSRPTWGTFLDPRAGGGVLFDLGVHPIALALLLAGTDRTIDVSATLDLSPDIEVDDLAVATIRFESGMTARIEASWREDDTVWDIQASSPTGVVRAELMPVASIELDGEPVALPQLVEDVDPHLERLGFVAEFRELLAVAAGAPSPIDARFGRRVLDIVCAAYFSAGNGSGPVALPFAGPRDVTPHRLWRS
jgi:predicted dehydrogenase